MPKNQLSFFATKSDLDSLLRVLESTLRLQYVRTGMYDSPVTVQIHSLLDVADLGSITQGDINLSPGYLVADGSIPIIAEPVPQRHGGVKYFVDQGANPKTIALWPGGLFDETCLISGRLGTVSQDSSSLELFRLFAKALKQQSTKIKAFYVGKEASELLDKGWRLTFNAKSPPLYDLRRD